MTFASSLKMRTLLSEAVCMAGSPPKVVWLRCGNAPTNQVESLIRSGAQAIQELLNSPDLHCLELY